MRLPLKYFILAFLLGLQFCTIFTVFHFGTHNIIEKYSRQSALERVENILANMDRQIPFHFSPAIKTGRLLQNAVLRSKHESSAALPHKTIFLEHLALHSQIQNISFISAQGQYTSVSRDNQKQEKGFIIKEIVDVYDGSSMKLQWLDDKFKEITHSTMPAELDFKPLTLSWYEHALQAKKMVWSKPFLIGSAKHVAVTMATPILAKNGHVLGVMGIAITLDEIAHLLAGLTNNTDGAAYLITAQGDFLSYSNQARIIQSIPGVEEKWSLIPALDFNDSIIRKTVQDMIESRRDTSQITLFAIDEGQEAMKSYYTVLRPLGNFPWLVGTYIPEPPILTASFITMFVLAVLSLTLLTIGIGLFVARFLVKPLTAIKKTMSSIKEDNPVSLTNTSNSIKEINGIFQEWLEVEKRMAQLQSSQEELLNNYEEQNRQLIASEHNHQGTIKSLENFHEPLLILDMAHKIIFANQAAANLLDAKVGKIFQKQFPFPIVLRKPFEVTIQTKGKKPIIAEIHIDDTKWEGENALIVLLRDISERKLAEESFSLSNKKLQDMVIKLETREEQLVAITRMIKLFQMCSSERDVYSIISENMENLFPVRSGAVYIRDEEINVFSKIHGWGNLSRTNDFFTLNDCWAVKTGEPHFYEPGKSMIMCQHINDGLALEKNYLCVPIASHREQLGLIYLQFDIDLDHDEDQEENITMMHSIRELCITTADHIALALSNTRLQEQLHRSSVKDSLTGLFNRRFMLESLQTEIFRALRDKINIGIILLDIDFFKKFNDQFGHAAGDSVLRTTAQLLRHTMRSGDICCRYGGEEFLVIMPDSSPEQTYNKAQVLRKEIEKSIFYHDKQTLPSVTISLGCAVFPEHGDAVETLIKVADDCLYHAKENGRNQVCTPETLAQLLFSTEEQGVDL